MEVFVLSEQDALPICPAQVRSICRQVVDFEGQRADEVSIQFVTTEQICELHARFFDDPSPTDCISFPIDSPEEKGYRVLGEVMVCPETAVKYASEHDLDPYQETTLYLVHGLLHLMGYDDIGDAEPLMREAEQKHMAKLQILDLFLKKPEEEL